MVGKRGEGKRKDGRVKRNDTEDDTEDDTEGGVCDESRVYGRSTQVLLWTSAGCLRSN